MAILTSKFVHVTADDGQAGILDLAHVVGATRDGGDVTILLDNGVRLTASGGLGAAYWALLVENSNRVAA